MNATERMKDCWRRGQRGWPASFPVAQLPNAPLWVALGGRVIAVRTDGAIHAYARATFYAGLAAWAWEELASGANWVRRALGAGGLIYVVDKLAARRVHSVCSKTSRPPTVYALKASRRVRGRRRR